MIILLVKSKLYSIEILISKTLIDLVISHDEFVLINVLKEYNEMKDKIKSLKRLNRTSYLATYQVYQRF